MLTARMTCNRAAPSQESFLFDATLRYRNSMKAGTVNQQPRQSAALEQFQAAAAEVDRTLFQLTLARSPRERLRTATRAQKALSKFHRHAST